MTYRFSPVMLAIWAILAFTSPTLACGGITQFLGGCKQPVEESTSSVSRGRFSYKSSHSYVNSHGETKLINKNSDFEMAAATALLEDGSSVEGMEAVVTTLENRALIKHKGESTIAGNASRRDGMTCQFSPWCMENRVISQQKWQYATSIVKSKKPGPSDPRLWCATHFHAIDKAAFEDGKYPNWASSPELIRVAAIGGHYFYCPIENEDALAIMAEKAFANGVNFSQVLMPLKLRVALAEANPEVMVKVAQIAAETPVLAYAPLPKPRPPVEALLAKVAEAEAMAKDKARTEVAAQATASNWSLNPRWFDMTPLDKTGKTMSSLQ